MTGAWFEFVESGLMDKSNWTMAYFFGLAFGSLIGALPFGFYLRRAFVTASPIKRRNILVFLTSSLLSGLVILTSPWSFSGILLDAAVLSMAVISYFGLVFLLSLLPPQRWTWVLTLIGTLPLAIAVLPLSLALVFIVGDEIPHSEGLLTRNYSYRINWFGNATTTYNGADFKLLYHPWPLSFLEKQVFVKRFVDGDCTVDKLEAHPAPGGKQILIDCPGAAQTVFSAE
jgi:hypothetical protein